MTRVLKNKWKYLSFGLLICIGLLGYWIYDSGVRVNFVGIIESETRGTIAILEQHSTSSISNLSSGEATLLRAQLISHYATVIDTVAFAELTNLEPWEERRLLDSLILLQTSLQEESEVLGLLDNQVRDDLSFEADPQWRSTQEHLVDAISELETIIAELDN